MEINGTNSLWKDFDVTALPLNASALSDKNENGIAVREYYFDGYTTVDGKVRSYIKILPRDDAKGVILYIADADGDPAPALEMFDRGYTVAILDNTGRYDGSRFTLFPPSLSACNCRGETTFPAPQDALFNRWFVWTCAARRAIILLKELFPNARIFAFGSGLGGSTVYKLCAFEDGLTAAATTLNILPNVVGTGNPIINYRAALDNRAYAPTTKVPLFMAVASNDRDNSLDAMSDLAASTASLACFRIVERALADGIKVVYDQTDRFFDSFESITEIPKPTVKAVNSENNLYFNINVDGMTETDGEEREKVELFASFCIENSRYRNWTNVPLITISKTEYMARVDILQDEKPVYVFVNVTDKIGNVVSSPILSVIPKSLGIPKQQTIHRRLVYEGNLGTDVWSSPDGGKVFVKSGPLEIDGVASDTNTLISFKPGDLLYKANPDSLLQIIISGAAQTVTVEVSDGNDIYAGYLEIPNSVDWHKITLASTEFKGAFGQLDDFSKIIVIKFTSDKEYIIGSMLWV